MLHRVLNVGAKRSRV